jgi:ornithine carbamoyltransferase
MKDLLRTSDLTPADVQIVLELSKIAKADPLCCQLLRGRTVVLYFAKPSTRTRLSTETAVVHLGGTPSRSSTPSPTGTTRCRASPTCSRSGSCSAICAAVASPT